MYPHLNPTYGITPAPTGTPEPTVWERIPEEVVRFGPLFLAGAVGGFLAKSLLAPLGVPGWLAWLVGALGLGSLILRVFKRAYAATAKSSS